MTRDRTKLPLWVQRELSVLEDRIQYLEGALNEVDIKNSGIRYYYLRDGVDNTDNIVYIPNESIIEIKYSSYTWLKIEKNTHGISITSDHVLKTIPAAANKIYIGIEHPLVDYDGR